MANEFWQQLKQQVGSIMEASKFSAILFAEIALIVAASFGAAYLLKEKVACDWGRILIPLVCPARQDQSFITHAIDASHGVPRIASVDWNDSKQLITRANEQFETIQLRKYLHLEMLMSFFKAYSWSILAILLAAPFAAVTVILLGTKGLSDASTALKATFFATTITASVAAAIPSVFGHQSSISANQALFLSYEDLGNQMKTYYDSGYRPAAKEPVQTGASSSKAQLDSCATNCLPSTQEIRKFLGYVDEEMKRLNQIAIAIDSSKIPAFTINPGRS